MSEPTCNVSDANNEWNKKALASKDERTYSRDQMDAEIAAARRRERNLAIKAIEILSAAKPWGAAVGAVAEDYPEVATAIRDHDAALRAEYAPLVEALRSISAIGVSSNPHNYLRCPLIAIEALRDFDARKG